MNDISNTQSEQKPRKTGPRWGIARDALLWSVGTGLGVVGILRVEPEWGSILTGSELNPYAAFLLLVPIFFVVYCVVFWVLRLSL